MEKSVHSYWHRDHIPVSLLRTILLQVLMATFCLDRWASGAEELVSVKTTQGVVMGTRYKLSKKAMVDDAKDITTITTIDTFLGIPFAQPPVGKLRFRRPQTFPAWAGSLMATTPPPVCPGLTPSSRPTQPPAPPAPQSPPNLGEASPAGLPPGLLGPAGVPTMPPPPAVLPPAPGDLPSPGSDHPAPPRVGSSVSTGDLPPGFTLPPGATLPLGFHLPPDFVTPFDLDIPSLDETVTGADGNPDLPPPVPTLPAGEGPPGGAGLTGTASRRKRQAPPVPELFASSEEEIVNVTRVDGPDMEVRSSATTTGDGSGGAGGGGDTTRSTHLEVTSAEIRSGGPTLNSTTSSPPVQPPSVTSPVFPVSSMIPDLEAVSPEVTNVSDLSTNSVPAPSSPPPVNMQSTATSPVLIGDGPAPPTDSSPGIGLGPFGTVRPNRGGPFGYRGSRTVEPMTTTLQDGPFGDRGVLGGGPFDGPTAIPIIVPPDIDDGFDFGMYDNFTAGNGLLSPWCPQCQNEPVAPPEIANPAMSAYPIAEDCLYLNIYCPRNMNKTASLPVIVFFHGGEFQKGNALTPNLSNLALETDSIIVTSAYRLQVYGFFSLTNSEQFPGNVGMWDQVMALEWVQKNIAAFGGDPGRVTLAGHDAGAMSVSLHMVSPASRGLFHGALSMSGVLLTLEGITQSTQSVSKKFLQQLQCESLNISGCLETAYLEDMVGSMSDFYPVIDGTFLPDNPLELLKRGDYNKVPYLLGLNSEEGLTMAVNLLRAGQVGGTDVMQNVMRKLNTLYDFDETRAGTYDQVGKLVCAKYDMCEGISTSGSLRVAINLFSDVLAFPIKTAADTLSTLESDVYVYYFNHTPSFSGEVYKESLGIETGAGHQESLHILLGLTDTPMSRYEQKLTSDLLALFRDFVHTGKPSLPQTGSNKEVWPRYTAYQGNYVGFGWPGQKETYKVKPGFPSGSLDFWSVVIPAYIKDLQRSCPVPKPPLLGSGHNIVIKTSYGKVSGVSHVHNSGALRYWEFLGIPYAAPPIGARRWQDPDPPSRWQHMHPAVLFAPSCPQVARGSHSEDCLYLNVWVPLVGTKRLPVLVFLHGGGFQTGSGNLPGILNLALTIKSVVVTVNYRLGPLGFLSLGNDDFPGNYAHKDILMALRWIQENIYEFRGDSDLVTLMGVDSGAAIAAQIGLSRHSIGLFSRVISIGGAATAPWANDLDPKQTAIGFAHILGCPTEDLGAMMQCLQGKDAMDLVNVKYAGTATTLHGYTSPLASYPWRPVVKGVKEWAFVKSRRDSLCFVGGASMARARNMAQQMSAGFEQNPHQFLNFLEQFVRKDMQASNSVYKAIKNEYFPEDVLNDKDMLKRAMANMLKDWGELSPLVESLDRFGNSVYGFIMDFLSQNQSDMMSLDYEITQILGNLTVVDHIITDPRVIFNFNLRIPSFMENCYLNNEFESEWSEYIYGNVFTWFGFQYNNAVQLNTPFDDVTASRMRLWTVVIPEMASAITCAQNSPTSNFRNSDVKYGRTNTEGSRSVDEIVTPVVFNLGLFESQIIMLTLGGVCVLLLCAFLILLVFTCHLKRRLVEIRKTGMVAFDDEVRHATKM